MKAFLPNSNAFTQWQELDTAYTFFANCTWQPGKCSVVQIRSHNLRTKKCSNQRHGRNVKFFQPFLGCGATSLKQIITLDKIWINYIELNKNALQIFKTWDAQIVLKQGKALTHVALAMFPACYRVKDYMVLHSCILPTSLLLRGNSIIL